jgi:hypothetical protein
MKHSIILRKLTMLIFLLFFTVMFSDICFCRDWQYSVVDTVGNNVSELQMRRGADGKIHILYYDYVGELIYHASRISTSWQVDTIDLGYDFDNFAVDNFDNLHIVATNNASSLEDLIYIVVAGGGIYIDTLFSINGRVLNADIELDDNDYPHISANFFNQTGTYLLYCYQNSSGWYQDTVTYIDSYTGTTDIELLSNGDIGIVSANPDSPGFVTYGLKHNGIWTTEIIYYYSDACYYNWVCLQYDSANNPHVVVHINPYMARGSVDFVDKADSEWRITSSLDSVYAAARNVPLSITSTDSMIIAFSSSDSLHRGCYYGYKSMDSTSWHYEIVESGATKTLVDMVTDTNNNIHICYLIDSCLKYAYSENSNSIFDSHIQNSPHGPNDLVIYPNPANASISFHLNNATELFPVEMYIYDVLGRIVYHQDNMILSKGANSLIINLDSPDIISGASGLYFLSLTSHDFEAQGKFILLK